MTTDRASVAGPVPVRARVLLAVGALPVNSMDSGIGQTPSTLSPGERRIVRAHPSVR